MLVQVAALFYIGTTKSHPPIPEHLSVEAKDFLLKCLQKYVIFIVFYSLFFFSNNCFDVLNIYCTGKLLIPGQNYFLRVVLLMSNLD